MTPIRMNAPGNLPDLPTDGEEVQAFLGGDEEAFERLVDRYQRSMLRFCQRLLHSAEDARDLFQDVFLQAFRSLDQLRDPDAFHTWLYRIAVRMSRKTRERRDRFGVALEEAEAVAAENLADPAQRAEDLDQLRQCLIALPPRQQEVLVLRNYEGMSYAQVGEILGITEESARASHYQGLRKLRRELGPGTQP